MSFQTLFQKHRFVLVLCCVIRLLSAFDIAGALDLDRSLDQCRLDVWTTKDGLPPQSIHAMEQTPDGYLWIATGAGLVRFDGETFHTFNSRNTPGLKRDNITKLMITQQGKLWIGTDGAGFGPFENGIFTPFRTGIKDESWSVVQAMLEARDGTIRIGGGGEHNLLRDTSGKFTRLPPSYVFVQDFV